MCHCKHARVFSGSAAVFLKQGHLVCSEKLEHVVLHVGFFSWKAPLPPYAWMGKDLSAPLLCMSSQSYRGNERLSSVLHKATAECAFLSALSFHDQRSTGFYHSLDDQEKSELRLSLCFLLLLSHFSGTLLLGLRIKPELVLTETRPWQLSWKLTPNVSLDW